MAKISNLNNPYNVAKVEIGEQVLVHAFTTIIYDEHSYRKCVRRPCKPTPMIITGLVKKAEGQYYPSSNSFNFGEHIPAYLKANNYVWLYEVKKSITDKPKLVRTTDIEKYDG